ncbi:MAG TPA: OmpH family outer membrane protein [Methylomirabilota bacterium]|nr:OmpH family outer membrane protein [Methylomirabilota bacterium]
MKNILKFIFPAILLIALGGSALAQTPKIATVDLGKVFTNYYKTKLAQVNLDDQKKQIIKDETALLDDLKKGDAEYKQLLDQANDQALSTDERDKNKKAADAKLKQMQESKAALDEYDRSAKTRLSDQFQRMRDKIIAEIRSAVTAKAKAAGYTLVLDSASETVNTTPVIVYNNGQADLTDEIVKQLNIAAPISFDATNSNSTLTSPGPTLLNTHQP